MPLCHIWSLGYVGFTDRRLGCAGIAKVKKPGSPGRATSPTGPRRGCGWFRARSDTQPQPRLSERCQALSRPSPYIVLTGPSSAAVNIRRRPHHCCQHQACRLTRDGMLGLTGSMMRDVFLYQRAFVRAQALTTSNFHSSTHVRSVLPNAAPLLGCLPASGPDRCQHHC